MAFERIAEQRIREAMQAGELDNLPNAGSRIDLEGYFSLPAHLRMAWSVLKSANCLPAEVLLLNDIARLERELARATPEQRDRVAAELRAAQLRLALALERLQSEARLQSTSTRP
jgi:DnaJ-like protein